MSVLLPSVSRAQLSQNAWLFKTRVQQGLEYDNNKFESRENSDSDALYKIILNSRAKFSAKGWAGQVQYHGGFQRYFFTPSENKLTNDLQSYFIYSSQDNRFSLGGRVQARFKYFHGYDWHYSLSNVEPFLGISLFQVGFILAYNREQLRYFNYDLFNYISHTLNVSASKRLKPNVQLQLNGGQQSRNYDRRALEFKPFLDSPLYSDFLQEDVSNFGGIKLSYQKRMLCSLEYVFLDNASNSYGFSFHKHRISLSAAVPLKNGVLIRLFGVLQRKDYAEPLNRIILTELDTERESSNFLIVDFSKRISPSMNVLLRGSWYNNESPIPGRYYQKSLTSICLEYLF